MVWSGEGKEGSTLMMNGIDASNYRERERGNRPIYCSVVWQLLLFVAPTKPVLAGLFHAVVSLLWDVRLGFGVALANTMSETCCRTARASA